MTLKRAQCAKGSRKWQEIEGCESPADIGGVGDLQRDANSGGMWRGSSFVIWGIF